MLRFFHLLGVVMVALLINVLRKGYQVRKRFQALKDQGIVSSTTTLQNRSYLTRMVANHEALDDPGPPWSCWKARFLSSIRCSWWLFDDDDPWELAWTFPTMHKVPACCLHWHMAFHQTNGDIPQLWRFESIHSATFLAQGVWTEACSLSFDKESRHCFHGGRRVEALAQETQPGF